MNAALILKRFKEMGLSPYEAKSYLSLLERDTLTVSEVSKIAGIPRTNAYEALERLMLKGMCVSKPGDTKKYSASDPVLLQDKFFMEANKAMEIKLANLDGKEKEILEKYEVAEKAHLKKLNKKQDQILQKYEVAKKVELAKLKQKQKEVFEKYRVSRKVELENLNKKKNELLKEKNVSRDNIDSIIKGLVPQYKSSRSNENPLDYIEIIKDPYQIHRKFIQLIKNAKKEILVLTKPPFTVSWEILREQVDQDITVLKRGVRIRVILEVPTDEDEKRCLFKLTDIAVRAGEKARTLKELPMKMAVFDSRIVIYFLEDPISGKISLTSQIIEHRALAKSLIILFETLWEQADDYSIVGNTRR